MTHTQYLLSFGAALCALSTGLLHAQSSPVEQFRTPFSFYVGDRGMPAGSYTVSKLDPLGKVLLIQDADASHSAFVLYNSTQSIKPVAQGEVTFHRYGDAYYISGLTVTGEEAGMEILRSMAEERTALAEQGKLSTTSVALLPVVLGFIRADLSDAGQPGEGR